MKLGVSLVQHKLRVARKEIAPATVKKETEKQAHSQQTQKGKESERCGVDQARGEKPSLALKDEGTK